MSEPFGSILTPGPYGSTGTGSAIYVYDCYEIKKAEVLVKYQKDRFGVTNLLTVGNAEVYCECLTKIHAGYLDLNLQDFFPFDLNNPGTITGGSMESGSFTWFQSSSKICCTPCATHNLTPVEAGEEIWLNDRCFCKNNAEPKKVSWRTTGESQGWDRDEPNIQADIKKALDQLGDCRCEPIPAGFKLRRGEGLA